MAIQKNINVETMGLEMNNAYHKIRRIGVTDKLINVEVYIYPTKQQSDDGKVPVSFGSYNLKLEDLNNIPGDNIVAQVYNWMKSNVELYKTDTLDV